MVNSTLYTLKRKRLGLTVRDVWYTNEIPYTDVDIIYYAQMDKPIGNNWYEQYTILNDLTLTKEQILAGINPIGRNEIRFIQKTEAYNYQIEYGEVKSSTINQFIEEYTQFAKQKELDSADVYRIHEYNKLGMLAITRVSNQAGEAVVWHLYRVNADRVSMLSTFTNAYKEPDERTRNIIGSANRFCHWKDLLYFKEQGVKLYDWGGWYNGKDHKGLLGINNFKEQFGGTITVNYNSTVYVSFKGKIFELVKKLLHKS